MRIGLPISYPDGPADRSLYGPQVVEAAQRAEAAGFDSLWVWDHFMWDVGSDLPMLEAYTTLGFVAAVTRTIKIGTMVTGVTHRHPGVLVKQVTTLDVLSGGRAYFGIGAAWFTQEHRNYGIPFPSTRERFERLEETLQIAHLMWADQGSYAAAQPFQGQYYQLERTLNVPQSIRRPHPPILVGGSGEKRTLRLVAQYADACNIHAQDMDQLDHRLGVLREHCREAGRPFEAIEKTILQLGPVSAGGRRGVTPTQMIDYCREIAARGIDALILTEGQINIFDPADIEVWAKEIIPAVRALPG